MTHPGSSETIDIIGNAYSWLLHLVRAAPHADGQDYYNQQCISMYQGWPLTAKVPPGYLVPNTNGEACEHVRHCGNEILRDLGNGTLVQVDAWNFTNVITRDEHTFVADIECGNWPDNEPPLTFQLRREDPDEDGWVRIAVYYYGKPANDTRDYPIEVYFEDQKIVDDHRTDPAGWVVWEERNEEYGLRGNKYFWRTEDQVAAKLFWNTIRSRDMRRFMCWDGWSDGSEWLYDIHSPIFNLGYGLCDDYMVQPASVNPTYQDCERDHFGCPNDFPMDSFRGTSAGGWGFSHRSKVCVWDDAYTWVLRQDPFGLLSQAMHIMMKYNDPNHNYQHPWPGGVPGGPPNPITPKDMVDWCWDNFWRSGVGCTMYQVPVIGNDNRASSLRTNQMLVATTLLGYHFGQGSTWTSRADEVAGILRQVQVGGYNQPAYGVWTQNGKVRRPGYNGAQLFVWDEVGSLGLVDFSWFRQFINNYFNLPTDDEDFILSTVETTATYAQAFRVWLYHKYGIVYGAYGECNIPGA